MDLPLVCIQVLTSSPRHTAFEALTGRQSHYVLYNPLSRVNVRESNRTQSDKTLDLWQAVRPRSSRRGHCGVACAGGIVTHSCREESEAVK